MTYDSIEREFEADSDSNPPQVFSMEEKRALVKRLLRNRIKPAPKSNSALSYGQKALFFLHRSNPQSAAYHVAFTVRILSPLNADALQRAVHSLLMRHDQLRATFRIEEGEPVQEISADPAFTFEQIDASDWSDEQMDHEVREAYRKPFDLERGPLFRAHLFSRNVHDHVFLITVHHIVYDAWSLWMNLAELEKLYRSEVDHTKIVLPKIEAGYFDFVEWQCQLLEGPKGDRLWDYWKTQLDGPLLPIDLPIDHSRPLLQSGYGKTFGFELDAEFTQQIQRAAKDQSVTPFAFLLGAFQILLHRYSGQDEILVGSPSAARGGPENARTVGYFVNTLVLRGELSGNPKLSDFLSQVKKTVLDAIDHQDFPFPLLIERLHPDRNPSYSPLVQVAFVYQKNFRRDHSLDLLTVMESGKRLEWGGLDLEFYAMEQQEGQFDLELEISECGEKYRGAFKYNAELFESSTIERMVSHLKTLLRGMIAEPRNRVGFLPIIDEPETRQLISWANDGTPLGTQSSDTNLCALFESCAETRPNAIAVSDGEACLSYRELNERANQLARYLRSRKDFKSGLVGLYMDRSIDLIIAILGILKTGCAYLPLDPSYPRERLDFMLADSEACLVLTQSNRLKNLPQFSGEAICIDRDWPEIENESKTNPDFAVRPDNLAYVIFTSGSTGKPKGVQITHRNVVRLFDSTDHWFHFSNRDVWTLFHSYAFDFSVWEIWGALLYGGRLVIVPYSLSREPKAFYELLAREQVTVLNQTPSAFRQLIQVEKDADEVRRLQLRFVIFGGEALDISCLKDWFARHGDDRPQLVNMYGITETTVHVTYRPLKISDLENDASVIGQPIPDLKLYILDKYLQPSPIGLVGELHVAGAGVSKGYLNRPELTEERFFPNPLIKHKQEILYKTGDLARFLPDGDIEYKGRCDSQVKIRGFRIELGEIEAALLNHPNIEQAVVMVREISIDDKRLFAYVVPGRSLQSSTEELRAYLKCHLPEHCVPAAIMILESMPINHNGKLDLAALPLPENWRGRSDQPLQIPRDIYEQQLVSIWEEVLKISPIGVDDNFFELGGHSLLAMGMMSRIERSLDVDVPLSMLFQAPTVRKLAEFLRRQASNVPWSPLVPIQAKGHKPRFFCIAGGVGSVLYYYPLARQLGSEQPFFGLQSKGIDGNNEPYSQVDDMARHYVDAIRSVQPEGPYWLGGHCFGGTVAFEVAQQLAKAGEEIALLALLDIPSPQTKTYSIEADQEDAIWVLRLGRLFEQASGKNLELFPDHLETLDLEAQADYLKEAMIKAEIVPPETGATQVLGMIRVFRTNSCAHYAAPKDFHRVPIALFRASEIHQDYDFSDADVDNSGIDKATLGWERYAKGPVDVNSVPGNHVTMLWEPHVTSLAAKLEAAFKKIRP